MTRHIPLAVGCTIIAVAVDFPWYVGTIAGLVLAILFTPSTPSHRVLIENVQTGEVKIQPNDQATQRYISGRGE